MRAWLLQRQGYGSANVEEVKEISEELKAMSGDMGKLSWLLGLALASLLFVLIFWGEEGLNCFFLFLGELGVGFRL